MGVVTIDSSLKRIAWAYGCSKHDGETEKLLRDLLLEKCRKIDNRVEERAAKLTASAVDGSRLDLVFEENLNEPRDSDKRLRTITEVGPKKSGELHEFEEEG